MRFGGRAPVRGGGGIGGQGRAGVRLAPRERYQAAQISRADLAQVLAACVGEPAVMPRTITIVNDEALAVGAWRKQLGQQPADR